MYKTPKAQASCKMSSCKSHSKSFVIAAGKKSKFCKNYFALPVKTENSFILNKTTFSQNLSLTEIRKNLSKLFEQQASNGSENPFFVSFFSSFLAKYDVF